MILFLKSLTDDLSEENIEKIFEGLDDSGDKSIDFEEFKVSLKFAWNLPETQNYKKGNG